MATRRWCGRSGAVPMVGTLTPAVVSVGSTFTVTINRRAVTFTATAATAANVTAGVAAACGASSYPEFAELAWADGTTVVTVTGPDDGTPCTLTATAGGTGSPTHTYATTTTASGPNRWSVAANWLENTVPVTGDDVTVDEGPDILDGLDQNAVTLASLTVGPNFEGTIGRPRLTPGGYTEYRDQRLKVGATLVTIETSSARIRLDLDTDATTLTVNDTGSPADGEVRALDVIGTHASSVARLNKGSVAFAGLSGETAQFSSVNVSFRTQRDSDADVLLGSGLTLATLNQNGGAVDLRCALTTHTKEGGSCVRSGSGAVATLYNRIGDYEDGGTGTVTTLHQAGTYRRTGLAAVTVTTASLYGGSVTRDPSGVMVWTNPVQLYECSLSSGPDDDTPSQGVAYFDPGRHRTLAIAG